MFHEKLGEDKYRLKIESVDHPERPVVKGIKRIKLKRFVNIQRVKGDTWHISEIRCFKN